MVIRSGTDGRIWMGIGKRLGTHKHPLKVALAMLGTMDLPASRAQSK